MGIEHPVDQVLSVFIFSHLSFFAFGMTLSYVQACLTLAPELPFHIPPTFVSDGLHHVSVHAPVTVIVPSLAVVPLSFSSVSNTLKEGASAAT